MRRTSPRRGIGQIEAGGLRLSLLPRKMSRSLLTARLQARRSRNCAQQIDVVARSGQPQFVCLGEGVEARFEVPDGCSTQTRLAFELIRRTDLQARRVLDTRAGRSGADGRRLEGPTHCAWT
jgi:hypothetical protein